MVKEVKAYWEKTTLQEYLSVERIPRGLRIKKFPIELPSNGFKKQWNDILSTCSTNLMNLIITFKTMELEKLREDITSLQQEILPLQNVTQFADLDQQLNEKVNKTEMDTIAG